MPKVPPNRTRCTAKTRAGKRCKKLRWTPPGSDIPLAVCIAHAPKEAQRAAGFGGPQEGSGRPRLERPIEAAQRIVTENAARMLRPYLLALGMEIDDAGTITYKERGAVVVGKDQFGGVFASRIEDLGAQMQAAELLFNRVFGRPRQATEISGPGGGEIPLPSQPAVLVPQDPYTVALLLSQAGALPDPEEKP